MITGVGLMSAVIGDGSGLPYHPLYVFLAIGFGSITLSWMNDSGFWVVQRLSGFTEETLRKWTVLLTVIAIVGLIEILVFSKICLWYDVEGLGWPFTPSSFFIESSHAGRCTPSLAGPAP